MKKLLIVTELFHPSVGGQEVRYLELGGLFVANGWQVEVATIGHDAATPDVETINNITVRRLTRAAAYKRPRSALRRSPLAILRFSLSVRRHLKRHRYDVVLFNLFPVLPQLLAAVPKGTIAVMDWCEHRSSGFWPIINRLLSRSTLKHISVSEGVGRLLVERYRIRDITCIPSGIFVKNYDATQEKNGVLFFGRLAKHKRPEEAIQAVILAQQRGWYSEHLTVAGDGPLLDELRSRYGRLPFIRILGRVSDEKKIGLFAEHKMHVLPSMREGFPRTIAESMASGTPTITTKHPDNGAVDVLNQFSCGVVVEPGAESLAQAIDGLTRNPHEWRQLSSQGLDRSAEIDWQHVYAKLIQHLGVTN